MVVTTRLRKCWNRLSNQTVIIITRWRLYAIASFQADGFELAKPIVHRAFQRCLRGLSPSVD